MSVVTWLRRQKDVDGDRIAVVGHDEGGAVALLAAAREKRDQGRRARRGVPGRTGRDVVIEQQQLALARSDDSEAEQGREDRAPAAR